MLDASFFCASVPGGSLSGKGSELPAEKVRKMQSSMYGTGVQSVAGCCQTLRDTGCLVSPLERSLYDSCGRVIPVHCHYAVMWLQCVPATLS